MALTQFVFGIIGPGGGSIPAMLASPLVSEGIAPSGSNQQTTAVALASHNICRVSTDTAVYVSFGTNPDATTAGTRFFLPANAVEYYGVVAGWEGAVVTA